MSFTGSIVKDAARDSCANDHTRRAMRQATACIWLDKVIRMHEGDNMVVDRETDWDYVTRSNYHSTFRFADNWIMKANQLIEAAGDLESSVRQAWIDLMRWYQARAEVVTPSSGVFPIYFMLLGFAVENLIKARLLMDNQVEFDRHVEEHGLLPDELKSHDLVGLANRVGWKYAIEEEDLLRRFTRCAIWSGRYPIPSKWDSYATASRFSDGKEYATEWFNEGDPERAQALIAKLRAELEV